MAQHPSNYHYNGSWDGEQPYDTAFEVDDIIECIYTGYDRLYSGDVSRVKEIKRGSFGQIIRLTDAPGYPMVPSTSHFFKSKNFKLLQKGPAKMAEQNILITADTRIIILAENGTIAATVDNGVSAQDDTKRIVETLVQKSPTKSFRVFELTKTASAPKIPVEWKTA